MRFSTLHPDGCFNSFYFFILVFFSVLRMPPNCTWLCSSASTVQSHLQSDPSAITLICLPPCLPLDCGVSVVRRVDLLHLTAPLLLGSQQCSPILAASQASLSVCSAQRPAHTQVHKNTHRRRLAKPRDWMLTQTHLAFSLPHCGSIICSLSMTVSYLLWEGILKHLFMFWQICVLLMNNTFFQS